MCIGPNLWITDHSATAKWLIAALTEASIAAPIVSNDQRSRRDGALDLEPTERLGATVEHDGRAERVNGIASVFPVVELGARLSMTHLDGTGRTGSGSGCGSAAAARPSPRVQSKLANPAFRPPQHGYCLCRACAGPISRSWLGQHQWRWPDLSWWHPVPWTQVCLMRRA